MNTKQKLHLQKFVVPNFVALDFEKMNNNPTSVCEVAMVKYEDGMEVERMHRLIKPVRGLVWNHHNKVLLRHIDEQRLIDAPTFEELHQKMASFIGENLLVCHNARADMNYLFYLERQAEVARSLCRNGYVDTQEIARKRHIGTTYELESVCVALLLHQYENHHQADYDAKTCGDIFVKMCQTFDYRPYIHTTPYRPKEDRHWDEKEFSDDVSVEELGRNVSLSNITFEDAVLSSFDFVDQRVIVTGMGEKGKSNIRFFILPRLGAIDQGDKVNSKTNVIIIGDVSRPGWRKLLDTLEQKATRPESFHVFSSDAFVKEMIRRGIMKQPCKPSWGLDNKLKERITKTNNTDDDNAYHKNDDFSFHTITNSAKKKRIDWGKFFGVIVTILIVIVKGVWAVCLMSICVVLWLLGIPVKPGSFK